MNTHAAVNIDTKIDVAVEMPCRVEPIEGASRLVPLDEPRWRAVLRRLEGKTVTVKVIRTKKRTSPQNAYLWGVVYVDILQGLRAIAEESGEEPVYTIDDDLHDAMKWLFLRVKEVFPGGEFIERPGKSRRLTMEQFSEFVSQVIRWAAGYGIEVRSSEDS